MTELASHLRHRGLLNQKQRWWLLFCACAIVSVLGLLNLAAGGAQAVVGKIAFFFFFPGVIVAAIQLRPHEVPQRSPDRFVVTGSRWACVSYTVICGFWACGGVLLYLQRPEIAVLAIPFVGLCTFGYFVALGYCFENKPAIVIDSQGFFDRSLRTGTIPWKNIRSARIRNVQGTNVISLDIDDVGVLMTRLSPTERMISRIDQIVGFELLHLGMVQMDADYIDEALDYILSKCGDKNQSGQFDMLLSHLAVEEDDSNTDQAGPL